MRRARWKRKNVRRVGLRRRSPPAAGGGWLAIPRGGQGRKRAAPGEAFGPGRSGIHSAPIFAAADLVVDESLRNGPMRASAPTTARVARSEAERAEREAGQMRSCTPTPSAPSATGQQLQESQKRIACRSASPNRSRHRSADPRTARRATAPERVKRPFLLDRARPVFFSGKTEKKMGGASWLDNPPAGAEPRWPPSGGPSLFGECRAQFSSAARCAPADSPW